ncbi:MAG TPA: hypothetical protein VIT45_08420 [Allosphingosinicella sp.]
MGNAEHVKTRRLTAGVAACALLFASPAAAAVPLPTAPTVTAAAPDCAAVAAERGALEAEHRAVRMAISDIALGRNRPKRKASASEVGRAAAGTLASLLLPFGLGIAANAAGAAASGSGKKKKDSRPPEPEPDVQALIQRQQEVEARLREIGKTDCPAKIMP